MADIRTAFPEDSDAIKALCLASFAEEERQLVASLAGQLLAEKTMPESFTLVAETEGQITGAIGFSPVSINTDSSWQGYILAPLAVSPDYQKQGIGSTLVNKGVEILTDRGINTLFVYGDPAYYGRFGFDVELAHLFNPPYPLTLPEGWQALTIGKDAIPGEHCTLSCVKSLADPVLW